MESLRSHIAYPFCSGAGPHPNYLIDLVSGLLLMGPGIGGGPPILAGEVFPRYHSTHFRVASAVSQTARQLSGAIGIAIIVAMMAGHTSSTPTAESFQWAFLHLAGVATLANVLASRLPTRVSTECST